MEADCRSPASPDRRAHRPIRRGAVIGALPRSGTSGLLFASWPPAWRLTHAGWKNSRRSPPGGGGEGFPGGGSGRRAERRRCRVPGRNRRTQSGPQSGGRDLYGAAGAFPGTRYQSRVAPRSCGLRASGARLARLQAGMRRASSTEERFGIVPW